MASDEDETVYCICRQPYDGERFMIECDVCKDWFHGNCVGIEEGQAAEVETYHCPNCQEEHGPLVLKRRRNWHRHDYSELDTGGIKAIQTGTVKFIQDLKNKTFPSADGVALKRMRGYEISMEYFLENGFDVPVLVDKKDGLDLKIPPSTFRIQDVENYVGSMREIDVIDVARQEDCKMLMREWVEYYNSPNRKKTYNVISLEFSNTKLAEMISPPRVVHELSWVSNYWPHESPDDSPSFIRPEVQRYCLMGVKDSFTDFHIDFGGTSVWYHVLWGEKIFYLIHPSNANMILYENWVSSSNQSEMFFGDQVDACYKCTVKQGQTLFIPTGWIHAVLTPIDSLVFGGNFLHNLQIELQIRVYEIEKRVKTPKTFLFPNYETLHWYAAKHILETLKECVEDGAPPPQHLLSGAKALSIALKSWTSKKDYAKHETVPETIQYGRLLKDLQKEVKSLTQKYGEKEKKKIKNTPFKGGKMAVSTQEKKPRGKKGDVKEETTESKPTGLKSPDFAMRVPKSGAYMEKDISVYDFDDDDDMKPLKLSHNSTGSSPQFSSPKGSLLSPRGTLSGSKGSLLMSPYSTSSIKEEDSASDIGGDLSTSFEAERKVSPLKLSNFDASRKVSPLKLGALVHSTPGLKLKVSGGKIVGGSKPSSADNLTSELTHESQQSSDNYVVDKVQQTIDEVAANYDGHADYEGTSASTVKPGSLKMKLSVTKQDLPVETSSGGELSTQDDISLTPSHSSFITSRSDSDEISTSQNTPKAAFGIARQPPPAPPGQNGSIADILEASGYDMGESDLSIDEDVGATPSMRDAIQGMLSMSRMQGGGCNSLTSGPWHPGAPKPKNLPALKLQRDGKRTTGRPEDNEKMPTCFKDEEYVYPTLDHSDQEDGHVFKPRGRLKKDETWNPKAKLQPNCPKPERPARQNAKREAVESGLAAAAAKLATLPKQKRPYIRKRPKQETISPPLSSYLEIPQPSTSFNSSDNSSALHQGGLKRQTSSSCPPCPPLKKRPKKGLATAKQRLGKILKMHKMIH